MKSLIARLVLAATVACGSASAQPVIKFVSPFAAGGGSDVYTRLVAAELSKSGTQVIVENKPGASGAIAADYVAKSKPDGRTLFVGSTTTMVFNPSQVEKLSYDPLKDFVPVSQIGYQPIILVGRNDSPYSNLQELIVYAKANPGKINRGSPGAGTPPNLGVLLFERMAGIKTTHIPFNGDPPALQALLGGSIDIYGTTITGPLAHVQSDKLRVLGVFDGKRLPQVPNAPTLKELGYDVEAYGWFVLVAPTGTPGDVIEQLNKAINQIISREDFIAKARAMGMEARGGSADELGRYIRAEHDRWTPLLKSLPKSN